MSALRLCLTVALLIGNSAWAGPAVKALTCALRPGNTKRLVSHLNEANAMSSTSEFGGGHTPQALEDLGRSGRKVEYKNLNGYNPNGNMKNMPPMKLTLQTPSGPQTAYLYTMDVTVNGGKPTFKTIISPSELRITNAGQKLSYVANPAFEAALTELTEEAMATATHQILTPKFLDYVKANRGATPLRVAVDVDLGGKRVPFVMMLGDETVRDALAAANAGRPLAQDSIFFKNLYPGRPLPGGTVFKP